APSRRSYPPLLNVIRTGAVLNAAVAASLPRRPARGAPIVRALARSGLVVGVVVLLLALWELYRWIWTSAGWTWPFIVNDTSMPHVWTIFKAFGQPAQVNQPALITVLLHKTVFTAKEAAAGFAVGAVIGFVLGAVLVHSRLL